MKGTVVICFVICFSILTALADVDLELTIVRAGHGLLVVLVCAAITGMSHCVCVCVCVKVGGGGAHVWHTACLWRSEDKCGVLTLLLSRGSQRRKSGHLTDSSR